jgi:pSer/pThr/pTyr-binding forkhead associated (FHA) protein
MPTLTIREPGRVAVRVAVADGDTVGRDPACNVVLHHRSVSRRHAKFTVAADGVHVVDLGSIHGVK